MERMFFFPDMMDWSVGYRIPSSQDIPSFLFESSSVLTANPSCKFASSSARSLSKARKYCKCAVQQETKSGRRPSSPAGDQVFPQINHLYIALLYCLISRTCISWSTVLGSKSGWCRTCCIKSFNSAAPVLYFLTCSCMRRSLREKIFAASVSKSGRRPSCIFYVT